MLLVWLIIAFVIFVLINIFLVERKLRHHMAESDLQHLEDKKNQQKQNDMIERAIKKSLQDHD